MLAASDLRLVESMLADPHHRELARLGTLLRFRRGKTLIYEGHVDDALYIVLEGRLKVYSEDLDGRELVYAIVGPDELVGEMSLDGGPRSATVAALEDSACAVVRRDAVRRYIAEQPDFAFHLLSVVIERARRATESARDIAFLDVYERVTRLFGRLASPRADGMRTLPRMTQQEIAARIGAGREMVSRVMKELVAGGYVELADQEIVLRRALPAQW